MKDNQFVKVATVSPKIEVGNPMFNIKQILNEVDHLIEKKPHFILFPELSVTGYTCQDLFLQKYLIEGNYNAINYFLKHNNYQGIVILGAIYSFRNNLFNCAYVIQGNNILGIVPKMYIPNYSEFYEKRHFLSGISLNDKNYFVDDFNTYFGALIFQESSKKVTFGIEICEDMWAPIAPSSFLSINGAEIVFNLSASNEVYDKDEVRRYTTQSVSRRNHIAYVYVSSSRYESTQDTVFSNHSLIVQNGEILSESALFSKEATVLVDDIDLNLLKFLRRKNSSLKDSFQLYNKEYQIIKTNCKFDDSDFEFCKKINKTPFVPTKNLEQSFKKMINIQVAALAKRMEHVQAKTIVLGISGGLDSTLALLIAYKTFLYLGKDILDILPVTMPGFGTSDRTYKNARNLGSSLGLNMMECDIKPSVLAQFQAINHDPFLKDVTYENAQARERTSILMNLANKHQGLQIGTGNLSELALGWCTYNGDQMSMYSINGGLPKTLVKFLVKAFADYEFYENELLRTTLYDILDTPISPELLSTSQKTEDIIGKYEVNDFIMYRFLECNDDEERINYLLNEVFGNDLSKEEIDKYLKIFFERFFSQQFKRSTMPDGPKVINISLSPRSDWRMPSDAKYK
ncbi:MAG: synthetase [Haloplasmataceae bacterium]|jgi:NAD+ synthase (glutamine-hydrolysing)|nr:synthetase [Haloplasmataceae bacterium]